MIFTMTENFAADERIYTLRISNLDLVRARLDEFDRRLVAECEGSNKVSDKLLALETIARRIEQRRPSEGQGG